MLPQVFNYHNGGSKGSEYEVDELDIVKNVLRELERLLMDANLPVSQRIALMLLLSTSLFFYPHQSMINLVHSVGSVLFPYNLQSG